MFSSHGLVSSIQITVLEDKDHITPSGREPFPLTTAISGGKGKLVLVWRCAICDIYAKLHLPVAPLSTPSLALGAGTENVLLQEALSSSPLRKETDMKIVRSGF